MWIDENGGFSAVGKPCITMGAKLDWMALYGMNVLEKLIDSRTHYAKAMVARMCKNNTSDIFVDNLIRDRILLDLAMEEARAAGRELGLLERPLVVPDIINDTKQLRDMFVVGYNDGRCSEGGVIWSRKTSGFQWFYAVEVRHQSTGLYSVVWVHKPVGSKQVRGENYRNALEAIRAAESTISDYANVEAEEDAATVEFYQELNQLEQDYPF